MEKLIKVTEAKQLAYAMFPDPSLRTAANRLLDDAPAADAVPVVHGRWKPMGEADYMCSKCGFRFTSCDPIAMFRFCRCGAKMDGERKEGE